MPNRHIFRIFMYHVHHWVSDISSKGFALICKQAKTSFTLLERLFANEEETLFISQCNVMMIKKVPCLLALPYHHLHHLWLFFVCWCSLLYVKLKTSKYAFTIPNLTFKSFLKQMFSIAVIFVKNVIKKRNMRQKTSKGKAFRTLSAAFCHGTCHGLVCFAYAM